MLKIAVVDDDNKFRNEIRDALERLFPNATKWSLEEYHDAEEFHKNFKENRPDIVLMDIMLPGENGIEAAKKIYAEDKRTIIVFVTISPDFALHGYGVNAAGYLLKPLDDRRLAEIMKTCRERLADARPVRITAKRENRLMQINLENISHIESINRKVHIHTDGETLECSGKLGDFIDQAPGAFIQTHKSFIVNFARVREISYNNAILDNGGIVPISRSCRQPARDAFFANIIEEEKGKTC